MKWVNVAQGLAQSKCWVHFRHLVVATVAPTAVILTLFCNSQCLPQSGFSSWVSLPPYLPTYFLSLSLSLFFLCSLSSVCFLFLFNFEATFMTATGAPFLVKMNKLFLFYVSPLLLNSLYTPILCHDFPAAAYMWAVSKTDFTNLVPDLVLTDLLHCRKGHFMWTL